jgi:hypothetical protein
MLSLIKTDIVEGLEPFARTTNLPLSKKLQKYVTPTESSAGKNSKRQIK